MVYLAERADNQFDKKVAIKLIRTNTLSDKVTEDFVEERQILANLEHAYISRLLDGGSTEAGLPYLVMEYIDGIPIDQFCHQNQLDITQRLALFSKICSAVQYAHQKLIVHCDLKPSNILITQNGEPRLLDFGISKLLDKSALTPTTSGDNTDERRLTLQYSSPEQIRGEPVSTLTDVYTLGVILYELLTDQRPYNIAGKDIQLIRQQVIKQTIIPPSQSKTHRSETTIKTDKVNKLREDLDNITLMALRKDPQQRYHSVAQFSSDINKYLKHKPVLATDGNWLYRSRKFLRRNRLASSLTAILVVAITGSGLALWKQSQRVIYERDLAIQNSERANAISNFLTNMFVEIDPYKGNGQDVMVKDVLEKASEQLNAKNEHALSNQPLVAAALHHVIGKVYIEIGMLNLAETHLTRAVASYRENKATLSKKYLDALFILSVIYDYQFDHQKNLPVMTEAYELSKKLFGEDHRDTLGALDNLGMFYMNIGDLGKAKTTLEQVYHRRKALFGEDHRHTLYSIAQLGTLNSLLGNYATSESYYRTCLKKRVQIYGKNHPYTLNCQSLLGLSLLTQHKYAEAKTVIEQHIQLASEILGENQPNVLSSKHNLADIYLGLGQLSKAEKLFRNTLELRRSTLGHDHIQTLQTQMRLAQVLRLQQHFEQAIPMISEILAKQTQALGSKQLITLNTAQEQAELMLDTQQYQLALTQGNKVLAARQQLLGNSHPELINTLVLLARAELALSHPQQAEDKMRQALQLTRQYKLLPESELLLGISQLIEFYKINPAPEKAEYFSHQLTLVQ